MLTKGLIGMLLPSSSLRLQLVLSGEAVVVSLDEDYRPKRISDELMAATVKQCKPSARGTVAAVKQ